MNNKEKIIQFLINKYNDSNSNPIKIDRTDISILQIPEKEIIKILNTLHEDGLIIAKPRSPHKDFSLYWEITIKTECLEYFNNKKRAKTTNRRDWIRTYVPITLSFSSIIISIIALIIAA
nr:MAG TPA: Transcription regulator, Crp family binding, winged helix-turn-helix motif [Caudoviricetes sp.]